MKVNVKQHYDITIDLPIWRDGKLARFESGRLVFFRSKRLRSCLVVRAIVENFELLHVHRQLHLLEVGIRNLDFSDRVGSSRANEPSFRLRVEQIPNRFSRHVKYVVQREHLILETVIRTFLPWQSNWVYLRVQRNIDFVLFTNYTFISKLYVLPITIVLVS